MIQSGPFGLRNHNRSSLTVGVSCIVVNWNTKDELDCCLDSLLHNDEPLEVIVVDNASHDGSSEMAKVKYPAVQLIANSSNLGFAGGVNQGIRRAQGEYILILNPDIVVGRETIEKLVKHMEGFHDVGAISPRLVHADGSPQRGYFRKYPGVMQVFLFYSALKSVSYKFHRLIEKYLEDVRVGNDFAYEVQQLPGAFMLIRRRVVDSVGFMDERFELFFEDVDWCFRMRQQGWRLQVVPSVAVTHVGGSSFLKERMEWLYGRFILSLNQFVDKHGSAFLKVWTKAITFGSSLLIVIARGVLRFVLWGSPGSLNRERFRVHLFVLKYLSGYYVLHSESVFRTPEEKR